MARSYDILIDKLDSFIRKYYKNQVFRGVLYSIGLIGGFFLLLAILEYFGRFSSQVRTVLFWSFTLSTIYVIGRFIAFPLVKLYRLGNVISYEQASRIIGQHFSEVQDKLVNTLQLNERQGINQSDASLVQASIDQKAAELSPVPFNNAIDLSANRQYLKYAIPPLAILIILLFAAPSMIKDSAQRLVQHNQEFVPEAPFTFHVANKELRIPAQEDLMLHVELKGDAFPQNVRIEFENGAFRMKKKGSMAFDYLVKNLQKDVTFTLEADGFRSESYTIKVLPKPVLLGFQVSLDYPSYTGLKDEVLRNTGDLTLPIGTKARWQFDTDHTEDLRIRFGYDSFSPEETSKGLYFLDQRLLRSSSYTISTRNQHMVSPDSITYSISVIPDLYPEISLEEQADSSNDRNLFFRGEIRDDHGFSRLTFNYVVRSDREDSTLVRGLQREDLPLSRAQTAERFYHGWSLDQMNIGAGDEVEYYFEVWDNDGVSGSKSTRSRAMTYEAPSLDELADKDEQANKDIKKDLEKSIKESKDLQKEVEALRKELLDKKNLDWQDKKKVEKLLDKQKKLQKQMESVQEKNEKNMKEQERYETVDEDLLEKQQKLQELFEELMSEEMKEMIREMEKLMEEKLDQDKIREQLEKMELSNEDIEAELDRNLELFKQFEFEKKAEDIKEKLDELAEKQEELSEETEKGDKSEEELKEEQEELNEEFDELKKEMDELEKLNEELENKNDMDMMGLEERIDEEMDNSSDELQDGDNKKASESQKSAAQKMQEMSQMMSSMAGGGEEQQQEDMDALRALLENIIELSFDQEEVMEDLRAVAKDDPKYITHSQTQRKLKDDAVIVKDSLLALSKRVIQIQSIVNKEINSVNANMDEAITRLADRKTAEATVKQQYVMTSLNNLALLLDEALQQMQNQMANSMPGKGNCQKPGGSGKGKPKMGEMGKMQKALSKRLEELQNGMNPGGKAGQGRSGMSEQLARTAAEQGAIRRELEKMSQELNKDGSGAGNDLKKIAKEMEETEKDIVNMDITRKTIERQQVILTRLLESEKAEREREKDNKRKSQEAQEYELSSPENFFEYQKAKRKEVELLRTVPPSLKPYYKNKVNEYFLNFEQP